MDCLDDGAVLAWLEGNLDHAARQRAAEHLDSCPSCLEMVAELSRGQMDPADRYDVGPEIARGGMGRVLAATDRLLGRRVALKTMRLPVADLYERFSREMRITARLQHPAIVPIYDAGVLPSGEPFYAMRMIAGRSLDRAVAEASSLTERLALLPAVIAVVDAIAYAHGEGVLHRDVKPQNVIVGPFGETVVLDWGLAKDLGAASAEPPSHASGEGAGTLAGEVLGTPAYMAPEQHAGAPVDERSDVYGLGGLLYHVLCGKPPHEGAGAPHAVRTDEIVPVEARQPDAPAELAAIVARALARDPDERYRSAVELGSELRRYQAGALVQAHRYSFGELARKWVARHRGAVAVGMISLVCVIVLSVVSVRKIVAERAQAEHERAQAQRERDRAEAQREAAEKLVGFVLHDLRERLEKVGRIDALSGVGAEVDEYYGRLPPRGGADLARRSAALGVLGDARAAGGDLTGALEAYRRGLQTAHASGDDDARCRAHHRIGGLLVSRSELAAASTEYAACADVARAHLGSAPGDGPWSYHLAASLTELGGIERLRGNYTEATLLIEESLRFAEGATGDEGLRVRIKATDDLGLVAIDRGDVERAAALFRENLARVERDAEAHPDDPDRRETLASILGQVGRVEIRRGDLDAAERSFTRARDVMAGLVDRDPANTGWLRILAGTEDFLGMIEQRRDRPALALAHAEASQAISLRLHRMDPTNVRWARDAAGGELAIASYLRELGRLDEARAACIRSLEIDERLAAANPEHAEHARDLAVVLLHLGDIETARGDLAGARAALTRSVAVGREMLAKEDTPRKRRELATTLLLLYDVPARTGDERAAQRRAIEEAHALLEPLRPLATEDAELRDTIAEVDVEWAKVARGP